MVKIFIGSIFMYKILFAILSCLSAMQTNAMWDEARAGAFDVSLPALKQNWTTVSAKLPGTNVAVKKCVLLGEYHESTMDHFIGLLSLIHI